MEELIRFIKECGYRRIKKIVPLKGDGSDRSFFRIYLENGSLVLVHNSPNNPARKWENLAFLVHSSNLRRYGIPVPQVIAEDLHRGLFLIEDLGDNHLQDVVKKVPQQASLRTWISAVELMALFHSRGSLAFDETVCPDGSCYDPVFVIEKELEYFRTAFLKSFLGLNITWDYLKDDFCFLAEKAGTWNCDSVIHRDFQSRNIMIHNGTFRLIDYQSMRYGPPEYDLASFVIDPYVSVPDSWKKRAINYYTGMRKDFNPVRLEYLMLTRNLQILGAFAFLGIVKGKKYFLNFIPRAWKILRENGLIRKNRNLRNLRKTVETADSHVKMHGHIAVKLL